MPRSAAPPSPSWCTRWTRSVERLGRWPTGAISRSACSMPQRSVCEEKSTGSLSALLARAMLAMNGMHVLTRGVALIGGCCTQGPAVWALRAQTDKLEYAKEMRTVLENTPNLSIREVRRHTTPSQLGSGCKGSAHSWRRFGAPSVCTTAHTADTVAPCCRINNCPSLSPGMRRQW